MHVGTVQSNMGTHQSHYGTISAHTKGTSTYTSSAGSSPPSNIQSGLHSGSIHKAPLGGPRKKKNDFDLKHEVLLEREMSSEESDENL